MARIYRTLQSREDVVEIVLYVRRENAAAARRLLDAIDETIAFLADFQLAGPRRDELAPGLRSFPVLRYSRYLVFYKPMNDGIQVIRVLHGSRDLHKALS